MPYSGTTEPCSQRSSSRDQPLRVRLRQVAKSFYFYEHRTRSIREWFIRFVLRRPITVRQLAFALRDVDLSIETGESVALIGSNGSGKSTILRLIAGIYRPTTGSVETAGRVSAVLELGAGFNQELTGADNMELYAAVLGISRKELALKYEQVVEFAGLRDVLDTPMKYYSTGMRARLALAVALHLEPDVLLLDEVLAVGDAEFYNKCIAHLRAYHRNGGTLIVVSHRVDTLQDLCARAVLLEDGRVTMDSDIAQVVRAYERLAGHH